MAKKKSKSKKNKPGRKSKYNEEILERVKAYARDGFTELEMCKKLNVGQTTFTYWKRLYPALMTALKENKEIVDNQVVGALLRNALGFEYTEEVVTKDGDVVEVKKYAAPNTTAQIFWLKNRQPDKWREKRETELTGKNGGPIEVKNTDIDLTGLTDEEIKKLEEIASRVKPGNSGDDSSGKG